MALVIIILLIIGYVLFLWALGNGFTKSHKDTRNPDCHIHEANRISFYLENKGLDLNRMLDSFKNLNPQYKLPDSSSMNDIQNCECCCILDEEEIYFDSLPKEIYWVNIGRHRYLPDFEGEHYGDIGYIDIVSTFKNNEWHCLLTSKLDSSEKRRIRNRINSILSLMPMIKDTSSHKYEFH